MLFVGLEERLGMYDYEESKMKLLYMILGNKYDILRLLTPRCGRTHGRAIISKPKFLECIDKYPLRAMKYESHIIFNRSYHYAKFENFAYFFGNYAVLNNSTQMIE